MRFRSTLLLPFLVLVPFCAFAADDPARLLPLPTCGPGWSLDGKVAVYDRETLSDRIDGEAEIFFPYGFQYLAYGRYLRGARAFDLDVYRMGSELDAFGMYAAYRPDGGEPLQVGNEGAVTPSQLFFYQERYFVRMQSTGEGDAGQGALAACARAVSASLPAGKGIPREAGLLQIPEVEKESIRYIASGLLGYDFFPKGLVADAVISGEPARVFLLFANSPSDAVKAFKSYHGYLQQGEGELKVVDGRTLLQGVDPLYGKVLAEQSGRYVFGMVRLKDPSAALPVMEKLRGRLAR